MHRSNKCVVKCPDIMGVNGHVVRLCIQCCQFLDWSSVMNLLAIQCLCCNKNVIFQSVLWYLISGLKRFLKF